MRSLAFVTILCFLFGCADFEENFVPVNSERQVDIKSFTLGDGKGKIYPDTFALYGPSTPVSYQLEIEKNDTVRVSVYIDDVFVASSQNDFGSFTINSDDYEDGLHKITFKVITDSGTGSLANIYEVELVEWTITRHFTISNQIITAAKITSIRPEQGRLKIEWENTGDVPTHKKLMFNATDLRESWEVTITDEDQTSYTDRIYIGGALSVRIVTLGTRSTVASPPSAATFPIPTIREYSSDEFGNLTLKWSKALFYENALGYSLSYEDETLKKTMSLNDTTAVTGKIPFWGPEYVVLRTYAKNLTTSFDTARVRATREVLVGENLGHFLGDMEHAPLAPEKGFRISPGTDELFVLNGDAIERKFSIPLALTFGDIAVSSDGSFVIYADNGKIHKADRNGNVTQILSTLAVYGENFIMTNLTLGADRYLTFERGTELYMYDIVDQVPVFERTSSNSRLYQTHDGRFLIEKFSFTMDVHALTDGKITSTTSVNMPAASIYIDVRKGNKIVGISNKLSTIYDPYTGTSTQVALTNSDLIYASNYVYDMVTGLAGTEYLDWFIVTDPHKGEIIRKIFVSRNTNEFMLYNGSVYVYSRKLNLKLQ